MVDGLKRAGAKPSRDSLSTGLESLGDQSYGGFGVVFASRPRRFELRGAVDADRRRPGAHLTRAGRASADLGGGRQAPQEGLAAGQLLEAHKFIGPVGLDDAARAAHHRRNP